MKNRYYSVTTHSKARARILPDWCRVTACFTGRRKRWPEQGEGLKLSYKGLVSGGVIRPTVSASWQGSKLGFSPPAEQRDRGPVLLDNDIPKGWLSGP